ncbi:MAG: hypothetical protein KDF67_18755 [Ottowia sp.]|nr:hypothetical protein [Ottowia sp.]MCB2071511.1 hypothetical protein [Ottowia sp.]HPR44711.1 hypothetical protein [Ottowia sp.]
MKQPPSPVSGTLEQVYLLERDAGLMCRILGLYAARGVDVLRVEYAYAAQDVMTLKVGVAPRSCEGSADVLRVLVARAASLVGVLAAAEVPLAEQRSQSQQAAVAVL